MCPAPTPFAILFLSLASSAAFNKSLVCSFFHLASFGFSLFSSVLWNCCCSVNGLTSCNIFWISHPVYCWWVCLFIYLFIWTLYVSSFVLISSETWLLIWAPAQTPSGKQKREATTMSQVNLIFSAGHSPRSMILNTPSSYAKLWPFQCPQVLSLQRGVGLLRKQTLHLFKMNNYDKRHASPLIISGSHIYRQAPGECKRKILWQSSCAPPEPLGGVLALCWQSEAAEQRWLYLPLTQCQ